MDAYLVLFGNLAALSDHAKLTSNQKMLQVLVHCLSFVVFRSYTDELTTRADAPSTG